MTCNIVQLYQKQYWRIPVDILQDLPDLEDVDVNEEQLITMAQQKKVRFLEG